MKAEIDISRRCFLSGLGSALVAIAAPAVIRTPGLLMPVRQPPVIVPTAAEVDAFAAGNWEHVEWLEYQITIDTDEATGERSYSMRRAS